MRMRQQTERQRRITLQHRATNQRRHNDDVRISQRGDGARMQLNIDERLLAEVRALLQVGEVNFKSARR